MRKLLCLNLILLASPFASAGTAACGDAPVSINVAFDYPSSAKNSLKGAAGHDAELFSHMAGKFSGPDQTHTLTDTDGMKKDEFIAKLRNLAMGHSTLNLNYAGHSLRLPSGESGWLMPGAEAAMKSNPYLEGCISAYAAGQPSHADSTLCPRIVAPFVLTAKEVRAALPNTKIFGILDTCFAEGFDLGKNSSMIYSSKKDQVALNGGYGSFSFSEMLELHIRGENGVTFGSLSKAVQAKDIVSLSDNQTPLAKTENWSDCYAIETGAAAARAASETQPPPLTQGDAQH